MSLVITSLPHLIAWDARHEEMSLLPSGKRSHGWLEYHHFLNRKYIFKGSIFHYCYVSLPECNLMELMFIQWVIGKQCWWFMDPGTL